jgi:TatD DNase family protein
MWKDLADSALTPEQRQEKWGGVEYWFVIGVHPHNAKDYTDEVEATLIQAMSHECCVGWGEIGLDYHYNLSPADKQREVLTRQLRHAVRLGKPLTIHTREADQDIEDILKAEVPKDHPIHIHCFTDNPQLAKNLLDHFPNLYIGITGVITYSTNTNTSDVITHLIQSAQSSSNSANTDTPNTDSQNARSPLRIVLETDSPYMTPAALNKGGPRLPFSHSAMIPWTAHFVAQTANAAAGATGAEGTEGMGEDGADESGEWTVEKVLQASRENAKRVYGDRIF